MTDITLLMRVVEDDDTQALYEITDIYLEQIEEWIKPYKKDAKDDIDDFTQECALVISEHILTKAFLEKNDRINIIKTGATQDLEAIYEELSFDLKEMCKNSIEELKRQNDSSKKKKKKMAAMVNVINEGAQRFKEEFYMEPTPDQLASYIGVTQDDIIEAMEASGYTITGIDFDLPEKI